MTTNVQIIMTSPAVQSHSTLVHKGHGAKGQPAIVRAIAGARYEIKDLASTDQLAVPKIKLQRVGKDLRVWFEGEAQADLIIEDFFGVQSDVQSSFFGHTESGELHEYVLPGQFLPQEIYSISESVWAQDLGIGPSAVDNSSAATGVLGLNFLQLLTGAAGSLAAVNGQIGKESTTSNDLVVQGQVLAGPVHSGVTVYAYDDQGQLLGVADVDGSGAWRMVVKGRADYTGAVFVRAEDNNAGDVNFLDEVTAIAGHQLASHGHAEPAKQRCAGRQPRCDHSRHASDRVGSTRGQTGGQ